MAVTRTGAGSIALLSVTRTGQAFASRAAVTREGPSLRTGALAMTDAYLGNSMGALTCCQPSPFSDRKKATTSCSSVSVSSSGMIVLSWWGF